MEPKQLEIQILEDRRRKNNLDNIEIEKELDILKDEPFQYLFRFNTDFGKEMEYVCQNILFKNILRVTGKNHDLIVVDLPEGHTDNRIESKAFRYMVEKTKDCSNYSDRSISQYDPKIKYCPKKKIYRYLKSTSSFQQVKPGMSNLFIFTVAYSTGLDVFILKADEHFTKNENCAKFREEGKCYITGQHEGNSPEGQIHVNDKVVLDNYKFSIIGKNGKFYYFDRDNKKILEEFEKIDIAKYL